ncbi:hypothetical protein KIPB_012495, partial [Kipferlia bialata]
TDDKVDGTLDASRRAETLSRVYSRFSTFSIHRHAKKAQVTPGRHERESDQATKDRQHTEARKRRRVVPNSTPSFVRWLWAHAGTDKYALADAYSAAAFRDVTNVCMDPQKPFPFDIMPSLAIRLSLATLTIPIPVRLADYMVAEDVSRLVELFFWLTHCVVFQPEDTSIPPKRRVRKNSSKVFSAAHGVDQSSGLIRNMSASDFALEVKREQSLAGLRIWSQSPTTKDMASDEEEGDFAGEIELSGNAFSLIVTIFRCMPSE